MESENEKEFVKTYRCILPDGKRENLYIKFKAEEMAECFINGVYAGFSLWNDHEFYISPYLKDKGNTVLVKITGSAANRYTDNKIDYGLI